MAKRSTSTPTTSSTAVEQRVVALAEQVGRLVGTVRARAEGWRGRNPEDGPTADREPVEESAADAAGPQPITPSVAKPRVAQARAAKPRSNNPSAETGTGSTAAKRAARPLVRSRGRSGGVVDAPGKKHRKPMPTATGVKGSDTSIAKLKASAVSRRRGGGR